MSRTKKTAAGPWGMAIRHWLVVRGMRQSDLARKTAIGTKQITWLVRGKPTTTRTLQKVAAALDVSIAELFIPAAEDRRRLIVDITEAVLREVEARTAAPPSVDDAIEAFGRAVERETPAVVRRRRSAHR